MKCFGPNNHCRTELQIYHNQVYSCYACWIYIAVSLSITIYPVCILCECAMHGNHLFDLLILVYCIGEREIWIFFHFCSNTHSISSISRIYIFILNFYGWCWLGSFSILIHLNPFSTLFQLLYPFIQISHSFEVMLLVFSLSCICILPV